MNVLQKKQENTNANITNVNTTGYKFQGIVQSTLESADMINHTNGRKENLVRPLGEYVYGNQLDEVYTDFSQGSLIETDKATNFAIVDSGFFVIQLDDGQYGYTRNGEFKVSDQGVLTTLDGYSVMGMDENNQLSTIPVESDQLSVDHQGYIAEAGRYLFIADFEDYESLTHLGNTIFTSDVGATRVTGEVRQGFLETSNIQITDEMVKLIEIAREFESNQKLLHAADETLSKAVNELGRL